MQDKPPFNVHYGHRRWRRIVREHLRRQPLCVMCEAEGKVTAAQIVDHIEPHRGDRNKFWHGARQSLCLWHHASAKQSLERLGYRKDIGADGWPTDPMHPVNKLEPVT